MKTLAYTALVILILASCKKSGAPIPKEKLLAKIYANDKLEKEFAYNSDKKLSTVKTYQNGSADPYSVETYEYDGNGFLKEKNRLYNGTPSRYLFQCNGFGEVVKMTEIDMTGADSGTVQLWMGYTYNVENRMIRIDYYSDDDKLLGYEEWSYANSGGLVSISIYKQLPGGPELLQRWDFQEATGRLGSGMQKAYIEPDRKEFMYLDAKAFKVTSYSGGFVQAVTEVEMSDRELEGPGMLSRQTITIDNTFPVAGAPAIKSMRYEYVEQ